MLPSFEMDGWRCSRVESNEDKAMDRGDERLRAMETGCWGGQGSARAVASTGRKRRNYYCHYIVLMPYCIVLYSSSSMAQQPNTGIPLLIPTWYTIFLNKLHKIKFLYMFRASSAHLQEVCDVNCTCMQPLVCPFSAGGRLVHLLRGDCSLPLSSAQDSHLQRMRTPEAAYMYN